jgi:hypothetical protein
LLKSYLRYAKNSERMLLQELTVSIRGMAGLNVKMDAVMRFFEAAAGIDLPFDPFPPRSPLYKRN